MQGARAGPERGLGRIGRAVLGARRHGAAREDEQAPPAGFRPGEPVGELPGAGAGHQQAESRPVSSAGRTTVTSALPSAAARSVWWAAPPGQAAASSAAPGPTIAQDAGPAPGAGTAARTQSTSNRSSW
ncbi:hypothetical protein [Streptomyces canarius]